MIECLCDERDGPIWRSIKPLDRRDLPRLGVILEKLNSVPNFLLGRPGTLLQPGLTVFEIDDVGLVALVPLEPGFAHVHVTFWDGRLRGRERLCRCLLNMALEFGYRSIGTAVPSTRSAVIAFAKRIGFQVVGEMDGNTRLLYSPGDWNG